MSWPLLGGILNIALSLVGDHLEGSSGTAISHLTDLLKVNDIVNGIDDVPKTLVSKLDLGLPSVSLDSWDTLIGATKSSLGLPALSLGSWSALVSATKSSLGLPTVALSTWANLESATKLSLGLPIGGFSSYMTQFIIDEVIPALSVNTILFDLVKEFVKNSCIKAGLSYSEISENELFKIEFGTSGANIVPADLLWFFDLLDNAVSDMIIEVADYFEDHPPECTFPSGLHLKLALKTGDVWTSFKYDFSDVMLKFITITDIKITVPFLDLSSIWDVFKAMFNLDVNDFNLGNSTNWWFRDFDDVIRQGFDCTPPRGYSAVKDLLTTDGTRLGLLLVIVILIRQLVGEELVVHIIKCGFKVSTSKAKQIVQILTKVNQISNDVNKIDNNLAVPEGETIWQQILSIIASITSIGSSVTSGFDNTTVSELKVIVLNILRNLGYNFF